MTKFKYKPCNETLEHSGLFGQVVKFHVGSIAMTPHRIFLGITFFAAILASCISFTLICCHLCRSRNDRQRRYIVRILLMIPIYCLMSSLSFLYYNYAIYFEVVRDCYEAFAIQQFYWLLSSYCGEWDPVNGFNVWNPTRRSNVQIPVPQRESTLKNTQQDKIRNADSEAPKTKSAGHIARKADWEATRFYIAKLVLSKNCNFPLCCISRSQKLRYNPRRWYKIITIFVYVYCVIRVVCTIAAAISEYFNKYCEHSDDPHYVHFWIEVLEFLGVTAAMTSLIDLYCELAIANTAGQINDQHENKGRLHLKRPPWWLRIRRVPSPGRLCRIWSKICCKCCCCVKTRHRVIEQCVKLETDRYGREESMYVLNHEYQRNEYINRPLGTDFDERHMLFYKHNTTAKVLTIKLIIFFGFWQTLLITWGQDVKHVSFTLLGRRYQPFGFFNSYGFNEWQIGLPAILTCVEMVVFGAWQFHAFHWHEPTPYLLEFWRRLQWAKSEAVNRDDLKFDEAFKQHLERMSMEKDRLTTIGTYDDAAHLLNYEPEIFRDMYNASQKRYRDCIDEIDRATLIRFRGPPKTNLIMGNFRRSVFLHNLLEVFNLMDEWQSIKTLSTGCCRRQKEGLLWRIARDDARYKEGLYYKPSAQLERLIHERQIQWDEFKSPTEPYGPPARSLSPDTESPDITKAYYAPRP